METSWSLNELLHKGEMALPQGGGITAVTVSGRHHSPMTVLEVNNGRFAFTALPERGMDVGELRLDGETFSWSRSRDYLLHPDHVELSANGGTGWLAGFYGAVASIGPELFGTPGEGYTLHGTGSYSPADPDSVIVQVSPDGIAVEGRVAVRGYGAAPVFGKRVRLFTRWGSALLLREETTVNVSDRPLTLDDGYHIQLCGPFLHAGGRYVLPAAADSLLLRDSAPPEEDPLRIPPLSAGPYPIRCYQYVPGAVKGLERLPDIGDYLPAMPSSRGITAEMVVNGSATAAGFVIRPLASFPRSLIAKEIAEGGFMFALEPCRTRPNRMSQKHADGEAFLLQPGASDTTQCLIGVTRETALIRKLEEQIRLPAADR